MNKWRGSLAWVVLFSAFMFLLMTIGFACTDNDADGDDDDNDDAASTGDDDSFAPDDDEDGGNNTWPGTDDDDLCDDDDYSAGDDDDNDTVGDDDDDAASPEYECPDTTAPAVLYLSADDSNSQASPVIARAIIEKGHIVPANKIRTYEFTNYYQIDYAYPDAGRINIVPQLKARTNGDYEGEYVLQIGAQSHRQTRDQGRPLNIVLSLDTSGSMEGSSISLLRDVCRAIAGKLREGDVISIVRWESSASVALESHVVDGPNDALLLDIINGLSADGSTNLHAGLVTAYRLAEENRDGRLSRVVLISDGQANTGITDIELIAQYADDSETEGIYLVGVGVGDPDEYFHDYLMDSVTDAGKGAYLYIDSTLEANKQFGERFMENMELAAMDVQVRLEMPYYFLMKEFHGEEYSSEPADVEPQHLGPNDAMVFHQYIIACDPSLIAGEDAITVEASYLEPFTREMQIDSKTMTINEMLDAANRQLLKGDAIVTYAEGLKEIAELIYSDPDQALAVFNEMKQQVAAAAEELQDGELLEISEQLDHYKSTLDGYVN